MLALYPAAQITSASFVNPTNPIQISIIFQEPMTTLNISMIQLNSAAMNTEIPVVGQGSAASPFQFSIRATAQLVTVTLPEGSVTSLTTNLTNTLSSWQLIYAPESLTTLSSAFYEPLRELRDNGQRWSVGKPNGGWFVTPIHANMIAETGKVLVTGWGRVEEFACTSKGSRRMGLSYLIDPVDFTSPVLDSYNITNIDESPRLSGDVLYCAGHTTLRDGRKLFTGGAWYKNLSRPEEKEYGIDYARMYDPKTNKFTQIPGTMPIGASWYPTNTHLPNGKVLVTGGFYAYCTTSDCTNPAIAMFDPFAYDNGNDPWKLLLAATESNKLINPGVKDYTHTIVLAEPVVRNNITYDLFMMGSAAHVLLFSTADTTPKELRFYEPHNSVRPSTSCAESATAVLLPTHEIMTMGGCQTSQIDIYNVQTDSWKTIETGIIRNNPASILLPTGEVLLINGENGVLDQTLPGLKQNDPRYPQLFNPFTLQISTYNISDSRFRGYHSMAALLKDGRILSGGGVHSRGDIGCEQPTLRIFTPHYQNKPKPIFDQQYHPGNKQTVTAGQQFTVGYTGPTVQSVVLLASQAFTHSFCQNQRYISLNFTSTPCFD